MWGCILGPMLNETVCSLGNQPLQVPNKTPFFFFHPLLLSKNIHNPLKQRGKEAGRNIKSLFQAL